MSEPIKVGDLAVVVRSHCGESGAGGYVGNVERVAVGNWTCRCGYRMLWITCAKLEYPRDPNGGYVPLSWVKRIDPLASGLDTETREELHA